MAVFSTVITELIFSLEMISNISLCVVSLSMVCYGNLIFCRSCLNLWLTILIMCLPDQHFTVDYLTVFLLKMSHVTAVPQMSYMTPPHIGRSDAPAAPATQSDVEKQPVPDSPPPQYSINRQVDK